MHCDHIFNDIEINGVDYIKLTISLMDVLSTTKTICTRCLPLSFIPSNGACFPTSIPSHKQTGFFCLL